MAFSDLVKPTDSTYFNFKNGPGNTVDADLVNSNFGQSEGFITNIITELQDNGAQTTVASTYTKLQTFSAGIAVDAITSTGTGVDTVYTNFGAGRFKIDSTDPTAEVATQAYVAQQIAAGVVSPIVFTGAGKTTDGASGLAPQPLSAQDDDRKYLRGDGDWEWIEEPFTAISSNTNAVVTTFYLADTSGGTFTLTLPASPEDNDFVLVTDATSSFGSNSLTIGRNGKTIQGAASDLIVDLDNATIKLKYYSTGGDWRIV